MRTTGIASTIALSLLWSASFSVAYADSAPIPGGSQEPHDAWMPEGIEWKKAEEVVVELDDDLFYPDLVELQLNKPYRLKLINIGDKPHNLIDLHFYHSVVIRRIVAGPAVVETPHIHSLYFRKGGELELFLVPVRRGDYEVYCTIPGHREAGMEGIVRIE